LCCSVIGMRFKGSEELRARLAVHQSPEPPKLDTFKRMLTPEESVRRDRGDPSVSRVIVGKALKYPYLWQGEGVQGVCPRVCQGCSAPQCGARSYRSGNRRCRRWLCIINLDLCLVLLVGACRCLLLTCAGRSPGGTGRGAGIDQTSRNGVPRVPSARSVPRSATPVWKAGGRSGERTSSKHMTPLSVYPEMRVALRGAPPQDNTESGREVRARVRAATESNPGAGARRGARKWGAGGRLVGLRSGEGWE